jgi:hypothetical protein
MKYSGGTWAAFCVLIVTTNMSCGGGGKAPAQQPAASPGYLVIRVDSVRVAPTGPNGGPWDGPEPTAREDNGGCSLLAAVVGGGAALAGFGLPAPVAGKAVEFLCRASEPEPRQQEQDPTKPDLQVRLSAGTSQPYVTEVVKDATLATFVHPFLVPVAAIPPDGLMLQVVDVDGADGGETIGAVRISAAEALQALQSPTRILAKRQPPSLEAVELVVSPYAALPPATLVMPVRDGTKKVEGSELLAGEVVRVSAAGRYQVGHYYDAPLTPAGYPGGGPKTYNFSYEPLKSANHGCGFALVGHQRREAALVATCGTFLSTQSGPLVVGVNDTDPSNNTGDVTFKVERRAPTADEWARQHTMGDDCRGWQ